MIRITDANVKPDHRESDHRDGTRAHFQPVMDIMLRSATMKPLVLSSIIRPKSILVATNLNDLDFLLPVAIDQA